LRVRVEEDGRRVFSELRDSCWLISKKNNPCVFSQNAFGWSNSGFSFEPSSGEPFHLSWRALIALAFGHECKARSDYNRLGEKPKEGSHLCDQSLCINFFHFLIEPTEMNRKRARGCYRHLKNFTHQGNRLEDDYRIRSDDGKIFCKGMKCKCPCHSGPEQLKCFWYEGRDVELGESADHTAEKVVQVSSIWR